jgi:hypothetical protein
MMKRVFDLRALLYLPLCVYVLSYAYLAWYHGKVFLFDTVVHEGGTYTLLQDIFYASHFLGHIPTHTTIALLFVGCYLCFAPSPQTSKMVKRIPVLLVVMALFLVASGILSAVWFGVEDTMAFVTQHKQTVRDDQQGGSWNLHIPSTMMQVLFIPIYLFIAMRLFAKQMTPSKKGVAYLLTGAGSFFLFTYLFNRNFADVLSLVWQSPRYLAHSVRELLTFPLTYYPVPLFLCLKESASSQRFDQSREERHLKNIIIGLSAAFILLFAYQAYIPLVRGVGNLAQNPSFAKGGQLTIPYLLTSHYFEHFLDTVYFSLLCLILYAFSEKRRLTSPFSNIPSQ